MEQIQYVIQQLCNRVKSPISHKVNNLASQGLWTELQQLNVDPTTYPTAFAYWADALCVDLVRKAAIRGGVNTALTAIDTFLETEHACKLVNRQMRYVTQNFGLAVSDVAFIDLLDRWKEKISYVMGRLPRVLEPAFSGGASTSTTKLYSTILDKMSTAPRRYAHSSEVTDHILYGSGWGKVVHESGNYPTTDDSNQYFTVPKNGLTDRSCCKEATWNMACQLSVGRHLRARLMKTLNIDLNHGAELHKIRAREGSIFDDVATIDLSSASDRWARDLVRYLVPWDWCGLLNTLRATHTSFGGKRLYLEKFSSMGNGFTFELETVLFVTLALTVQQDTGIMGEILCYGDDLIVPAGMAPALCAALTRVGHKVNLKKSHLSGPFRESCGGDYFHGSMVNTVKLETIPEAPQHWISFANNLRRVAAGRKDYWALVLPVWRLVIQQLPYQMRGLRGPVHLGDAVIHDDEEHWKTCPVTGRVRGYTPVAATRSINHPIYTSPLAKILYLTLVESTGDRERLSLPQVTGHRLRWMDPTFGSDWLPGTAFRRVDPRVTFAYRYTWYR